MKKGIEIAVYVICTVILAWLLLSWIDVVLHNGNENPVYAEWNLLTMIFMKGGN